MIKKCLVALIGAFMFTNAEAKNVGEMFISVPDSIMPYVTKEQRAELIGMKNIDPASAAEMNIALKTTMVLDSLFDNYMKVMVGQIKYEIIRLNTVDADSVFCVMHTLVAPERETVCCLYDKEWNLLQNVDFNDLIIKSNISDDEKEIVEKMEFPMIEAQFERETSTIILTVSVPLVWKDEKLKSNRRMQRKLKWNGESFKEC